MCCVAAASGARAEEARAGVSAAAARAIIAPKICGLRATQSISSDLLTVTKSAARKTDVTPSVAKSRRASGDACASLSERKSREPLSKTSLPGRNLSASGFGVDSVWMNSRRAASAHGRRAAKVEELAAAGRARLRSIRTGLAFQRCQ